MDRVLSAEEARSEYIKTLDGLAQTALFQYTLLGATYYFLTSDLSTPASFFGLELSKIQWVYVLFGLTSATNFYIARRVTYLTALIYMHPWQRRKLKYLTWHHSWVFNPFRAKRLRYSNKTIKSKHFRSVKIGRFKLTASSFNVYFYLNNLLTPYTLLLFSLWLENYGDSVSLTNKLLFGPFLLGLLFLNFESGVSLDRAISRHTWVLWGYRYPWSHRSTY